MNEKTNSILLVICVCILAAVLSGAVFFTIGQHSGNNNGAGDYSARAQRLGGEFADSQRRTEEGNIREGSRIISEGERLERARNRTEETDRDLERLRSFGERENQLFENARKEIGILSDYHRDIRGILFGSGDSDTGE
jgi:hypothetical protein